MPMAGDRRSADGLIVGPGFRVLVEAETHLNDVQETERRIAGKARDPQADRVILLLLESRHHQALRSASSALQQRYPVGARIALAALERGADPGGDCVITL